MIKRNVKSSAKITVKQIYSVGQGFPLPSDLGQHFNKPVDDHSSFFPIKVLLVTKVRVEVVDLHEILVFFFDVVEWIVLEIDVDFCDFGLKFSQLLFWCFFRHFTNN